MRAESECTELLRDAWAALRTSDLHDSPKLLVDAMADMSGGEVGYLLVELLEALTSTEAGLETALDRIVHQHGAAHKIIDRWVKQVVQAEDKRGQWESYVESEG